MLAVARRWLQAIRHRLRQVRNPFLAWLRRSRHRVRQMLAPRLGIHYQYPPRALRLFQPSEAELPPALPVISIVTPSFNHAAFLERTIQSVLGQGYAQLQYVVQDGGSTDGTRTILNRYRRRLAHCESRRDKGQTNAINLGFRHANGDILAYLNSDDVLLPGALAYVARYFLDHPRVDVIYSHRVIIDEDDQEVGRWILPFHDNRVLSWNDYVPQETLFWRQRIWERIGGQLDETFQFAMDWDLLIRFRDAGARFARVPRFLAAFRVHPRQKTCSQIADLGYPEIARLRERCLGRMVTEEEVRRNVRPFLRQHVVLRMLHKLGMTA
jgi:glycosyltransferase involved in cell wall biosynthesis